MVKFAFSFVVAISMLFLIVSCDLGTLMETENDSAEMEELLRLVRLNENLQPYLSKDIFERPNWNGRQRFNSRKDDFQRKQTHTIRRATQMKWS